MAAVSSVGVVILAAALSWPGAAPSARAAGPSTKAAAATSPVQFNRITYSYGSTLSISQEANRYQVLVLQASDGAMVAKLHAANPALKILMYDTPTWSTTSALAATPVTCTDYQADLANHPSWFLTDKNGNRIQRAGYAGDFLMDLGNPAYQQACIAQAIGAAKHAGFDGIFYDGFDAALLWLVPAGVSSVKYPTVSAWQAATSSFIAATVPAAHAQGVLVFGNIGGATFTPGLWQQWAGVLDGAIEESWTDGRLGLAQQIPDWPAKLANIAWSDAHGKYALVHSWNTTQAGNVYGLASMMLVANGRTSYSTSNGNYVSAEAWYPEYSTAQQLGAALGAYSKLSNGVYARQFASGMVLVNPTAKTVPSFSLGGTYSGSGLTKVTSVSMGPTSGLILLGAGHGPSVAPPPPPTPPVHATPKPKRRIKPRIRCVVPTLAHLRLTDAKKRVSRAHCRVGKITRRRSSRRNRRHVLGQNPRAHTHLALGAKIRITVGR